MNPPLLFADSQIVVTCLTPKPAVSVSAAELWVTPEHPAHLLVNLTTPPDRDILVFAVSDAENFARVSGAIESANHSPWHRVAAHAHFCMGTRVQERACLSLHPKTSVTSSQSQ